MAVRSPDELQDKEVGKKFPQELSPDPTRVRSKNAFTERTGKRESAKNNKSQLFQTSIDEENNHHTIV